ncbi:MAG: glycosyltransferase family 39 protein [Candidatus Omnitrophica bacterium]|nr:glycosyltransferase family 39 protein [Candidatus Omnitrophota bacterium]
MNKDFTGDETLLIGISKLDVGSVIPALKHIDAYPPLTYLAIHYMMQVSHSEAFVRLYFVFFGIGNCVLIYLMARELLDEGFANIVLMLSALSPLLIFASQYVRSYIDSSFWMLASVLFMLKILKGSNSRFCWIGYMISASLAVYTFYFSALLIFTQFLFVTVFFHNNMKYLVKWYAAFLTVGILFLPWAPSALQQFRNASSIIFDWSSKGFVIGPFKVGVYLRNISAILGFDPFFMVFEKGINAHFSRFSLLVVAIIAAAIFLLALVRSVRILLFRFQSRRYIAWFFPFMVFVPVLSAWVAAALINTYPTSKYFVAFHSMYLILLSIIIISVLKKNKVFGFIFVFTVVLAYALRIPQAVSVEFDNKGAMSYLQDKVESGAPVLCIRSLLNESMKDAIRLDPFIKLNEKGTEYIVSSMSEWSSVKNRISVFPKVLGYKIYGNDEIFGANKLLDNLAEDAGFSISSVKKFKNIDVIEYEK